MDKEIDSREAGMGKRAQKDGGGQGLRAQTLPAVEER